MSSPPPARPQEEIITVHVAPPDVPLQQIQDGRLPSDTWLPQLVVPATEANRAWSMKMRESARELRGWLMVLATVVASITYASGLSPPGGFRTDRDTPTAAPCSCCSYLDGGVTVSPSPSPSAAPGIAPLLSKESPARYRAFYYCNTAAFALSLSIVLLLASRDLRKLAMTKALEILVGLDVLALLVAYIAGSTFGVLELAVCSGLVLIVPVALIVVSSSRLGGKYFWDELSSKMN